MQVPGSLADGIVVINLDDRPDRWKSFQESVAPSFLPLQATRVPAVRGVSLPGFGQPPYFRGRKRDRTWAGRGGCALSHRAAISIAVEAGWERVLILEDDVETDTDFARLSSRVGTELQKLEWDVCYLGFTDPLGPFRKKVDIDDGYALYQIYGCNAAHAYLVNRSAYSVLLEKLPTQANVWEWLTRYRAIDRWYSRSLSRRHQVLALSPSIINQSDGISDITGRSYETAHVTKIPAPSSHAIAYPVRYLARRAYFAAEGIYDAIRGAIKRYKGF